MQKVRFEIEMGSIRDNIRWAWQASAGRRAAIALCCVMEVLHIAVSMVFIWISKHIIDIATGNSDGTLGASTVYLVVCVLVQLAPGWKSFMKSG